MATEHPVNYGFVIDNRRCIGCHACSTACKSENEVPLGVYRTWVKTTETGQYPNTQRHFQVTRCNHCANPPCVRICPTAAMHQRVDGIVVFDNAKCIGCKACMQACPYDAIYIDPETSTAAKCHFCAHRIEIGLEPACVVVCPEHAILAGDLNDPQSEIGQVVARNKLTVRKPEQGTAPKLFYIEGHDVNLHPTATARSPVTFAATDVLPLHHGNAEPMSAQAGQLGTVSQPQGLPVAGPISIGGRRAEHMVQVGYNAQHKVPWHWQVPAYLVTKGIGAGVAIVFFALWLAGFVEMSAPLGSLTALTSLVGLGLTTALLVLDLEQPKRFLYMLIYPQWNSWLTRGAVLLIGTSLFASLWWGAETAVWAGILEPEILADARTVLSYVTLFFSIGAAIYTAFLFGQAEGRDLWQSPLLPVHLLTQAVMAGSAALLVFTLFFGPGSLVGVTMLILLVALVIDLGLIAAEFLMPHASEVATRAAHDITHGRYRFAFWRDALLIGHLVPAVILAALIANHGDALVSASSTVVWSGFAVLAILFGLYRFEHAFIMAPQEVPNS